MLKNFRVIFGLAIIIILIGCNSQNDQTSRNGTAWGVGSFNSNGKRIYFTATSDSGSAITYTDGPSMGMMMMGGRLACVSCHGTDARGGRHRMHMEIMDAPDIRWAALSEDHHEEQANSEENEEDHTYTFEDFRNAVEKGEHPDGDELKHDMPRWTMSNADLHDLMDYLKSLH